ncbi:MAG: hypothetical protein GXC75_00055 [Xanthomonadaceae bacterium]|nr:hypothetical protein [Xanthomonadaceae bacterium]
MSNGGQAGPNRKTGLRLAIGYAIGIASIAFVLRHLQVNADEFLAALSGIDLSRILFSAAFFLIAISVNALAFAMTAKAADMPCSASDAYGAWLTSLLSKYIPIGIGHIAGRGMLLAARGASWRSVVATGVFEQLVSLVWCLLIAGVLYAGGAPTWMVLIVPVVVIAIGGASAFAFHQAGLQASNRGLALASILYACAMLPYAAGYVALVMPADIHAFVAALFAGTVAGVITVVAPGGIGIRETVAATMAVGNDAGRVVAGLLVARVVILATEVAGTVVGAFLLNRRSKGGDDVY